MTLLLSLLIFCPLAFVIGYSAAVIVDWLWRPKSKPPREITREELRVLMQATPKMDPVERVADVIEREP